MHRNPINTLVALVTSGLGWFCGKCMWKQQQIRQKEHKPNRSVN